MAEIKKTNIYSYLKTKLSNTASHIKMNGTQSAGTSNLMARADHVHPTDTSRAPLNHDHTALKVTKALTTDDVLDDLVETGRYKVSSDVITELTGGELTDGGTLEVFLWDDNSVNYVHQFYYMISSTVTDGDVYYRYRRAGTWKSWRKFTFDDEDNYIKNVGGVITSNLIADGTIRNGDIADGTIQARKLTDGTLTATQLASNAVEEAKIKNNAVSTDKIGSKSVTTAKIDDSAVTATQLASNAVEEAKIKNNAITTDKISNSNVTMSKLAAEVQKDGFMNSTTIGETDFDLNSLNTAASQGKYYCAYNKISNLSNAPYSSGHNMLLFVWNNESSKIVQIAFELYDSYTVGRIYYRLSNSVDNWTPWQRFAAASEIPTKTSDLTNDGADGNNAYVKNNDPRLSDNRTPTSHTHGNITNAGAIGSTANLPVITTSSGKLTTGSFGNAANTFCEGNDSRVTDTSNSVLAYSFKDSDGGTNPLQLTVKKGTAITVYFKTMQSTIPSGFLSCVFEINGTLNAKQVSDGSASLTINLNAGSYIGHVWVQNAKGWIGGTVFQVTVRN